MPFPRKRRPLQFSEDEMRKGFNDLFDSVLTTGKLVQAAEAVRTVQYPDPVEDAVRFIEPFHDRVAGIFDATVLITGVNVSIRQLGGDREAPTA